jgi:hypothetical protein
VQADSTTPGALAKERGHVAGCGSHLGCLAGCAQLTRLRTRESQPDASPVRERGEEGVGPDSSRARCDKPPSVLNPPSVCVLFN